MTYSFYRFLPSDALIWACLVIVAIVGIGAILGFRKIIVSSSLEARSKFLKEAVIVAAVIGAVGLITALYVLASLVLNMPSGTDPDIDGADLRWHASLILATLGAIGGIFTLGFATVRAWATERQTKTSEQQSKHEQEVLINQRIQGALEQLSARYTRTRMGRTIEHGRTKRHKILQWHDESTEIPKGLVKPKVGDWEAVQFSEPDIQTRLSGIGQFEAIAKEEAIANQVERGRAINEHLANFIRANSPASLAVPKPERSDGESDEDYDAKLRNWANGLSLQADIQAALSLIARSEDEALTESLDLRKTCLQGAELIEKNLKKADLRGAHLEGADLERAHLEEANLMGAHLERADLLGAKLEGANLWRAHLEGANLERAHLKGAILQNAHLERSTLENAHLEGTNLAVAHLEEAYLRDAHLEEAYLWAAHLEGANLRRAHLERANLWDAHFDKDTDFNDAVIQYASVKSSDLSMVNLDQTQVNSMFGDGTMTADKLPEDISRPAHWPNFELGIEQFRDGYIDRLKQERDKWAADPENYVPPTE